MTTRRTGAVLAELVVALMIAGAAAVIGISLLVTAERRTRADATADRTTQAARDVARILTAEIEAALPESVAVRGDTALDLQSHIAASVACVVSGSVVVLPGAATSAGLPFTYVRQLPGLLPRWIPFRRGQTAAVARRRVAIEPSQTVWRQSPLRGFGSTARCPQRSPRVRRCASTVVPDGSSTAAVTRPGPSATGAARTRAVPARNQSQVPSRLLPTPDCRSLCCRQE